MPEKRILVGVIGRAHGVRGLVRVHSYTVDPADLANFYPLLDERGREYALRWAGEGIAELFTLDGGLRRKVADRTAAEAFTNIKLFVDRDVLPPADDDEFYFADLIGLEAVDADGASIGRVAEVHDYGGGASLEIGGRYVPFTRACVPTIDLAAGRMTVALPTEIDVPAPVPNRDALAHGEPEQVGP